MFVSLPSCRGATEALPSGQQLSKLSQATANCLKPNRRRNGIALNKQALLSDSLMLQQMRVVLARLEMHRRIRRYRREPQNRNDILSHHSCDFAVSGTSAPNGGFKRR